MLALILATLATAGVFLYSQAVKEDARQGGDLVAVVVSSVDIPANTDLNSLIRDGAFRSLEVPREAVISDAVTQLSQLENQRNGVFIFAGEQIPLARVQGGEIPGGLLSIPEGHQALTVALDAPRAISGTLAGGDNVSIWGTFTGVEIVRFNKKFEVSETDNPPRFDTTIVLVPQVEVLRVIREVTNVTEQVQDASANTSIQVVLALTPEEAQRFIYGIEQGLVYLSLIPPGEEGVQLNPLTAARLFLPGGKNANAEAGAEG
jgi:Flp pilus assembly protein CpaB